MKYPRITVVNWRTAPHPPHGPTTTIYVGRPSALGNPFAISSTCTRARAIEQYLPWLEHQLTDKHSAAFEMLQRLKEQALNPHWAEIRLECWCAPLLCHADFLVLYLRGEQYLKALQDLRGEQYLKTLQDQDPEPAHPDLVSSR